MKKNKRKTNFASLTQKTYKLNLLSHSLSESTNQKLGIKSRLDIFNQEY